MPRTPERHARAWENSWMGILQLFGNVFIPYPWMALVPGLFFAGFFRLSRRRVVGLTAVAWFLYAVYEYGMLRRWTCSGECNIRIDLLLAYPILFLLSGVAIVVAMNAVLHPDTE